MPHIEPFNVNYKYIKLMKNVLVAHNDEVERVI